MRKDEAQEGILPGAGPGSPAPNEPAVDRRERIHFAGLPLEFQQPTPEEQDVMLRALAEYRASKAEDGGPRTEDEARQPECELRARVCLHRMADGQCQRSMKQCLLFAGAPEVREMMAEVRQEFATAARREFKLLQENEELRRLQSEGLFKFALRVQPADFQAFAAIIALGNRKAAAEFLEVPVRSFYGRVERWRGRGADYTRMFRMLEWRKATDRKMAVRLGDSLLSSGTGAGPENPETLRAVLASLKDRDAAGYPDILRQVFAALKEQNAENWLSVRDELISILKEEV